MNKRLPHCHHRDGREGTYSRNKIGSFVIFPILVDGLTLINFLLKLYNGQISLLLKQLYCFFFYKYYHHRRRHHFCECNTMIFFYIQTIHFTIYARMIYTNYILKFLNNNRQRVWTIIINMDHFPQYHLKTQTQKPKKKKGSHVSAHVLYTIM